MSIWPSHVHRLRIRVRARKDVEQHLDAPLCANVATDPRARLRCGTLAASDGADIPYRLWLARKPSAAVVLLHGAFDYSAAFEEIGPKLGRRGFTALAIDQRGFGATASRGVWAGAKRLADDVADAVRFLSSRINVPVPIFLLGESMGGAIAIHAAAKGALPQVQGLVLAAPGALASPFRHRLIAWLAALTRLLLGDAELVFERLSGPILTPAAAIRLIGDPLVMRNIHPEMLCGMADLALASVDKAKDVTVPALILVGARDELVRQSCIRRLFDNLAGEKTWIIVADAPHLLLHWRRNAQVLRQATRWLSRRAGAGAISQNSAQDRSLALGPMTA